MDDSSVFCTKVTENNLLYHIFDVKSLNKYETANIRHSDFLMQADCSGQQKQNISEIKSTVLSKL